MRIDFTGEGGYFGEGLEVELEGVGASAEELLCGGGGAAGEDYGGAVLDEELCCGESDAVGAADDENVLAGVSHSGCWGIL